MVKGIHFLEVILEAKSNRQFSTSVILKVQHCNYLLAVYTPSEFTTPGTSHGVIPSTQFLYNQSQLY